MFKIITATLLLIFAVTAYAQTVSVTFNINTSTMNDYRWADSTASIQVRGGIWRNEGHNQEILSWNAASEEFTNIGGDYWTATVAFPDSFIGDRIDWKVGATLTNLDETTSDFWEEYSGNRGEFPLPAQDTTLPLAYVSATAPPYTPSDSVDLYFRVNMSENPDFDLETGTPVLSIVGHFPGPDGAANMWSPGTYPLEREGESDYWSFQLKLAQGYIDTVENIKFDAPWPESARGMHMYRFALGTDWNNNENLGGKYWPNNENRVIYLKNHTSDTTIAWKWWNDAAAQGFTGEDTVDISFTADFTKAIENFGFTPGDTVVVRMGYENSAAPPILETKPLEKTGFGNTYGTDTTVVTEVGAELYYSYYIIKYGEDQKETFYDFTSPVTGPPAERRRVEITGTAVDVIDDETDISSLRRQPLFPNTTKTLDTTTVVFTCDLRPAYYQVQAGSTLDDIQAGYDITPSDLESIMTWGVRINGPATGDWAPWGINLEEDADRLMYDDGTHGDEVAGDSIFSVTYGYPADTQKGVEFKFGVRGGDNEGGYGNNHHENIDDSDEIIYVHSQFGSIDPLFYSAWDYENQMPLALEDLGTGIPNVFALDQNYPNPFNPVTNITFKLPKSGEVNLVVYNLLGQKIKTLVNKKLQAGTYSYTWKGLNESGVQVPSGVYLYRIDTKDNTDIKKMVLVK